MAAETRYLSNAGDDAADGRTPATAWRTIARMNRGTEPGDTVCLRRGDVFYGTVLVAGGPDADHCTTVTAYGEGPKPVVSATKNLKCDPAIWDCKSTGYSSWTGRTGCTAAGEAGATSRTFGSRTATSRTSEGPS